VRQLHKKKILQFIIEATLLDKAFEAVVNAPRGTFRGKVQAVFMNELFFC